MRCDIIIPVWNNLDLTKECIEAIEKNTRYPYRLILIDNGSDEATRRYLGELSEKGADKVRLVSNGENLGYVMAINQGLRASDAPYVCMFNNDTLPAPGWLEKMVDFAEKHPDVGLINPQCDGHGTGSIEEHAKYLAHFKGYYMEMNQCQGFCMLIRRELIDKIGYLDEAFGVGGYDDTDYSMRTHVAGYKSAAIKDAYVYHRLHASFDMAGDREEWVKKNQAIYYKKWGKHLRMAVAVSIHRFDAETLAHLVHLAYGLAREWTWVHVLINSPLDTEEIARRMNEILKKEDLPPHQNIRINYFKMPRPLMGLTVSCKLLERLRKRMRDKRFDAVVVLDGAVSAPVPLAARIAGASVVSLSTTGNIDDWQKKGKEIALFIKNKRREYE